MFIRFQAQHNPLFFNNSVSHIARHPAFGRSTMNYHVEILIYYVIYIIALYYLFYSGSKFLKEKFDLDKRGIDYKEAYLQEKRVNIINTVSFTICTLIFIVSAVFLIFPTPLSVPLVQITKQGEMIPLPYGAWLPNILENESSYVRLEPTYSDCNIWQKMHGITRDGVYVEGLSAIAFVNIGTPTFYFTDHKAFYKHYKTEGVNGFCEDLQDIVFNEVFSRQLIYPQSTFSEEEIDQAQKNLKARLLQVFTKKFQDKGIVPVTE